MGLARSQKGDSFTRQKREPVEEGHTKSKRSRDFCVDGTEETLREGWNGEVWVRSYLTWR